MGLSYSQGLYSNKQGDPGLVWSCVCLKLWDIAKKPLTEGGGTVEGTLNSTIKVQRDQHKVHLFCVQGKKS